MEYRRCAVLTDEYLSSVGPDETSSHPGNGMNQTPDFGRPTSTDHTEVWLEDLSRALGSVAYTNVGADWSI
jgi:hypothetical protein